MKKFYLFGLALSSLFVGCAQQEIKFDSLGLNLLGSNPRPETLEMNYFSDRREKVFSQMEENSIMIIPGNNEITRTHDQNFEFRQDSNFYYLTGFDEPESVAVLIKTKTEKKFILFVRPNDPFSEQWQGRRAGLEGARLEYLADESYEISDLNRTIKELISNKSKLYYDFGNYPKYDVLAEKWKTNFERNSVKPIRSLLLQMRLIKDEYEQYLIGKASRISASAHKKAMLAARTSNFEYELEAEIRYETTKFGAPRQSYSPIVASGLNATILHYNSNDRRFEKNDLILIDAAAEYMNYTTDITRTFPASGRFTDEQKEIYNLVLKAQLAAIEQVKPGTRMRDLQVTTIRVITEGLVDLGIIKSNGKSIERLIQEGAYEPFYMHGCCHPVGLDVHDPVDSIPSSNIIKPGMIFTIEPGIYINETIRNIDAKWTNIGVRIEDTILVTPDGYKILTEDAPKEIADIEEFMS